MVPARTATSRQSRVWLRFVMRNAFTRKVSSKVGTLMVPPPPSGELDLNDFRGTATSELPKPGFNAAQVTEEYLSRCDAVRDPPVVRLTGLQHHVKVVAKGSQDVVMVMRWPA